jgi:hypothetical protein
VLTTDLSLEDQAALTAGRDFWHTAPLERLGVASLRVTDGPVGARGHRWSVGTSACLPCGSALAATWNRDLVRRVGRVLADEARAQAARDADVAVVIVGYDGGWESEGADRPHMGLPGEQDDLIRAVAAANPRTVVVLNAGALREFAKLELDVGQTRRVTFDLPPRAFAHWDAQQKAWLVEPGEREIQVGSSSRDIRQTARVVVSGASLTAKENPWRAS